MTDGIRGQPRGSTHPNKPTVWADQFTDLPFLFVKKYTEIDTNRLKEYKYARKLHRL